MLRHCQILQDSTGSNDTVFQVLHSETFQILRFKVFQQFLTGSRFCKYPVVQLECKELVTEITFKHQVFATFKKNFLRGKVIQQFVYIIKRSFCSKEFTGRNIEKSNSTGSLSEMNGSQEVILFIVQNIIIDRNTRSNQFGNTTLHQLLRHFGVFELVADSDTFSSANQFRKVGIKGMMRKTCHLDSFSFPIGTFCQCDP